MSTLEIILLSLLAVVFVLALMNARAAYRNGAVDGYGFAREPGNPGYRHAGLYLSRFMVHRWNELSGKSHECMCPHCEYIRQRTAVADTLHAEQEVKSDG